MRVTETESLVQDCVTFRLTEKEALEYIEKRFKKISETSYKQRKGRIMSDESTELWLNHFTRIGFIEHHKEQIETIKMIQRDSIQQLQIEKQREPRNQLLILKMREDIRENSKLLSELGVGTPIIAELKIRM